VSSTILSDRQENTVETELPEYEAIVREEMPPLYDRVIQTPPVRLS
jgi:hypothetical protein